MFVFITGYQHLCIGEKQSLDLIGAEVQANGSGIRFQLCQTIFQ